MRGYCDMGNSDSRDRHRTPRIISTTHRGMSAGNCAPYNRTAHQSPLYSRSPAMLRRLTLPAVLCVFATLRLCVSPAAAQESDWASSVKFPASEKPVHLFNGKNFDGWEGNTGEGGTPK